MKIEIFNSERYFTVHDYFLSHKQLLLRSSKDEINLENIDIVFFGVEYIQLCTSLKSILINKIDWDKNLFHSNSIETFLSREKNSVFELTSNEEKFYVAASIVKIYLNELEYNQTSLGLHSVIGRQKEIASST